MVETWWNTSRRASSALRRSARVATEWDVELAAQCAQQTALGHEKPNGATRWNTVLIDG